MEEGVPKRAKTDDCCRVLSAKDTGLELVPREIENVSRALLQRNRITSLADMPSCVYLTELVLKENELVSLPEAFFKLLPVIAILDLRANKLSRLSDSIGECTHLEELYVGQNRLLTLPDVEIASIKWVSANRNFIKRVPPRLMASPLLQHVDQRKTPRRETPSLLRRPTNTRKS